MIVPRYWAEGRAQHRSKDKQVTVRRFGWSDVSESDAQAKADARADEALKRLLAGEKLARREPKIPYNGAQGVPIREEVLERHGETVITRNGYGARCLNTPNVLFADIDFHSEPVLQLRIAIFAVLVVGAAAVGWLLHSLPLVAILTVLSFFATGTVASWLHKARHGSREGEEASIRRRIQAYLARHPEFNFRLYRTPAGMRLLATHRTFSPSDPVVADLFNALQVDAIYARMCTNQQCFRARVSAKPWRIGIPDHLRPRPGVWPVAPDRLPQRQSWIARYEAAAKSFAACTFLEALGSGAVHHEVRAVQDLHDALCRATTSLPIA